MAVPESNAAYRDLVETAREPDGARYSGVLDDGTPVDVIRLAPELSAAVRDEAKFFETLERAALVRHPALGSPLVWGLNQDGSLHLAYFRTGAEPVPSGLSSTDVAQLGLELLRALDVVHATGLAHGAIAPRRVLRGAKTVMLTEFGLLPALIAGGVDVRSAVAATSEPAYVCPEVQHGGVPDERSDLFALGAVLYETLTGKPPFGGRTTAYVLASVLADEQDGNAERAANESGNPVVDALLRAIERAPDDRWPSARAFAQALTTAVSPQPGENASPPARPGCLPAAAAVVAAIGLGFGVFG
jgi:serine/threonine protein kinase